LIANDKRWDAEALVLWFIVMCKSAGANGHGGVGVAAVGDVGEFPVGIAIGGVGIEGAGEVGEAGGAVSAALACAAVDSVIVGDVGDVNKADGII